MRNARLALAAVILASSMPADASMFSALADLQKPNMKIGQMGIHPYFGVTETYDDNIYLVPPDRDGNAVAGGGVRGSFITSPNAGVGLNLPIGDLQRFNANYDFRHDFYQKQSKANDATSQKVEGAYAVKGSRFNGRLFDTYVNTQDPAFNPNNGNIVAPELVARKQRWQNTAGGAFEYGLTDTAFFGIDAQDTVHHYLEPSLAASLNRSEVLFGFKAGYKIQPKTRLYIAGHRQIVHYTAGRPSNHKDWLADFGIEGEFTAKLKGQVQAGVQHREYDLDRGYVGRRIAQQWQTSVGLNYKATERDEINLRVNRGLNETATAGSGGGYYASSGAGIDASHEMGKVKAGANAGYQTDKYAEAITLGGNTAIRRDDLYNYGVKLDYKIQEWLLAGVGYVYSRRHSVFSQQFNYKDSRTSASIKFMF